MHIWAAFILNPSIFSPFYAQVIFFLDEKWTHSLYNTPVFKKNSANHFFMCIYFFLFISHAKHSCLSLLSSCSPYSLPTHPYPFLKKGKVSHGSQQGLEHSDEAETSPPALHKGWARYPTIENGLPQALSCTRESSWSHSQGFHKSQVCNMVTHMQGLVQQISYYFSLGSVSFSEIFKRY